MRPTPLVVDASVAVAVVFDEPSSSDARAVIAATQEGRYQLVAPTFWLLECGNASWKRSQRGAVDQREAHERFLHITQLPVTLIDEAPLFVPALESAMWYGITTYDALYAVTADYVGGVLVTADSRLLRALRQGAWPGDAAHVSEWPEV